MKHVGDITKLNGAELPVVNIITGGSPCQDLSVAGKRAGLAGERSGLFMEQIRLVKEMRENDRKERRSDAGTDEHIRLRTRYMVWENVPGAFSSNGGEDFRAVLEETAKVADKDAVIPRPPKKWESSGCILGDGWSIAWRTHDAQYWGVPQRRKRICMVADFDGDTAGKILFDVQLRGEAEYNEYFQTFAGAGNESESQIQSVGKSLSGDSEPSEQERKGTSRDIEKCSAASSYTLKIRGGVEVDSHGNKAGKGPLVQTELSATLGVSQDQTLITGCLNSWDVQSKRVFNSESVCATLNSGSTESGNIVPSVCLNPLDVQSKHIQPENGMAEALCSGECRGSGGESYVMQENVLMEAYQHHGYRESDNCGTLTAEQNQSIRGDTPLVINERNVYSSDGDIAGTLDASYYKGCGMRQGVERTIVLNDQGGHQMDVSDDVTATLRAQEHGHQPVVLGFNRERCGAVCAEELVPTIQAAAGESGNNQPMIVYGISAYESNAMKSSNPHSGIYETETARTLDLNGGSPACNQGGVAVVQSFDGFNLNKTEELSPTLMCQRTDTKNVPSVFCLEGNGTRESHRGDGYLKSETMYTLNTVEQHAVCIGNGQMCNITMKPIANSLDCMHEQQAVIAFSDTHNALNARDGRSGVHTQMLDAPEQNFVVECKNDPSSLGMEHKESDKQDITQEKMLLPGSVVRRLTPLECERLQGYPDGWTDIGEWVDSKGKKHKDADSPRYKALGNSIALPFWEWMANRMVAYLRKDGIIEPTMASLFDGLGGFPLVYSRCGCKPVWASEIEEFPIAVTKIRFPEE